MRNAERRFISKLLGIAKNIQHIIDSIKDDPTVSHALAIANSLNAYGNIIEPWAKATARATLSDINKRNIKAWEEQSREIGKGLRHIIEETPVGAIFNESLDRQVTLIKSLPLEASMRVHEVVRNQLPKGTRATDIAAEILKTNNIPKWRAKLIARTEVSRAAEELTKARAMALGSEGYLWQTSQDADVRPEHQAMAGKYVRWDEPPTFDDGGGAYHAGCIWNCRCWSSPVLPDF